MPSLSLFHASPGLLLPEPHCASSDSHTLSSLRSPPLIPLPEDSKLPSIDELVLVIHKCKASKDLTSARKLHSWICSNGLEVPCSVGAYFLPLFVDCGGIPDAQRAFNRLSEHDERSWTSLILGYVHCGETDHAFNLYTEMLEHNVQSSPYTLLALLKVCTTTKNAEKGQDVHAEIILNGFECASFISNALINMYARCGSIFQAQSTFNKLQEQDVISWTTLISGYVEHGNEREALRCFDQMKLMGISPNSYTYACALKACNNLAAIWKGKEIHAEIRQKGLGSDLFIGNNLVCLYARHGLLSEAQDVFDKLAVKDVVVWTTIISELTEHGFGENALIYFERMQEEGVAPTHLTYVCVLKACAILGDIEQCLKFHTEIEFKGFQKDLSVTNSLISMYAKCGLLTEAQRAFDKVSQADIISWNALVSGYADHGAGGQAIYCFEMMLHRGLSPNAITFSSIFKACGSIGAIIDGRKFHGLLKGSEFETDIQISNSLVAMYSKCGSVTEAQSTFDNLSSKTVVSWNALISGYAACGFPKKALELFESMQLEEMIPDSVTYSCVLKICGSIGALDLGREVHDSIREHGLAKELLICRSLIIMYAECGSLPEAQAVFDELPVRDAAAWSLMMKYFGMNHMGCMAMQSFQKMLQEGVKPDSITFTSLLSACNHASLLDEGYDILKVMKGEFGVNPTTQHYNCIINLLSKSGHLYDAERFLEMLCSTSEEMWAAVLTSCKTYGEVDLGLRCFEKLVQMNPTDSAWYVLMADLYAYVGRWDEAYRIEELRIYAGAKKKAAIAFIEVNKEVHEFAVGEGVNNQLLSIMNNVKHTGHLPHLDLVLKPVPDGEKEAALCEHAEKLAIAFGLLHTPQGTTLRVSKNLRMCIDCHNISKIISKVEKREIILRDSCCIHHFKDNICSCGDMF